jgi:hypothetical protein
MTAEQIKATMKEIRNRENIMVRVHYNTYQEFGRIENVDLGKLFIYNVNEFECYHSEDDLTMVCDSKFYRFKAQDIASIATTKHFINIYLKENEDMKTRERYDFTTNYEAIDKALMINGRCRGFITDFKHCIDDINYGKIVCDIIECEDLDSGCKVTVMIDADVIKETKYGVMVYGIETYDCKCHYDPEFAMVHYEF